MNCELKLGEKVKVVKISDKRSCYKNMIQSLINSEYECTIAKIDLKDINGLVIMIESCEGNIWLYEDEFVGKFKISNILKENISISCEGLDCKYITYKNGEFINDKHEKYNITLDDLTSNKWFEVEEVYKTNYEFNHGDRYYYVDKDNSIDYFKFVADRVDMNVKAAFNAFPNEELAEYSAARIELARKIDAFANLNNEKGKPFKYFISSFINKNNEFKYSVESTNCSVTLGAQFTDRKVAEKCLDLYKDDIEKCLRMKQQLHNI